MRLLPILPLLFLAFFQPHVRARELDTGALESALAKVAEGFDGRIGACIQAGQRTACIHGDQRFSLQSVMKLAVAIAALDGVDKGRWRTDDAVTVRTQDLSLYVQPLADLVGPSGYQTTVGDLVRRAIIDSDSAATDFLIARMGGPAAVQAVVRAKGIPGVRVDRDERHLQTEIVGFTWRPEYVDAKVLERAMKAVPNATRRKAYAAYQVDPRDTATPKGMALLLWRLAQGELLSTTSTEYLLKAMYECRTFPDRLKAGISTGWTIAHKTGTSGSWEGLTAATNDVGIVTAPDGGRLSVAVFVADSRASSADRAAVIARIAAAAVAHCR